MFCYISEETTYWFTENKLQNFASLKEGEQSQWLPTLEPIKELLASIYPPFFPFSVSWILLCSSSIRELSLMATTMISKYPSYSASRKATVQPTRDFPIPRSHNLRRNQGLAKLWRGRASVSACSGDGAEGAHWRCCHLRGWYQRAGPSPQLSLLSPLRKETLSTSDELSTRICNPQLLECPAPQHSVPGAALSEMGS